MLRKKENPMMGRKRTALRLFYQLPTERELCYL
jgi:hypothetical protein